MAKRRRSFGPAETPFAKKGGDALEKREDRCQKNGGEPIFSPEEGRTTFNTNHRALQRRPRGGVQYPRKKKGKGKKDMAEPREEKVGEKTQGQGKIFDDEGERGKDRNETRQRGDCEKERENFLRNGGKHGRRT